jgi:transposase-like protein
LLEPGRARRRYTKEFKAELVAQCRGLGVSMARVAMAHGINANLLRRWVVESTGQALRPVVDSASATSGVDAAPLPVVQHEHARPPRAEFVPVNVKPAARSDLHIEIERGDVHVKVTWPIDAGHASAAWLRELLR